MVIIAMEKTFTEREKACSRGLIPILNEVVKKGYSEVTY